MLRTRCTCRRTPSRGWGIGRSRSTPIYATYAYLQTAQDAAARRIVDALGPIAARIQANAAGVAAPATAGHFAVAAIPARYALERGDWAAAAALQPTEAGPPWIRAVTFFARALGSARLGRADDAARDLDTLVSLGETLKKTNDTYWAGQVDIERRVAAAWIAFARGRRDEAIAAMREAAGMEDATDKSAISPGPLKPARELLGEMLLEADRPADALAEFDKTMQKEPNRFRGIYGAARAAERAGDRTRARTLYARLLTICERAETPPRAELVEARTVAGR
jgi:tetratricopeptide (TPR) repeat protein